VPDRMSLYAALLGDSADDNQLAWMMEGLLTAQVTTALARLGIPDQLAGGPLTASELASRVGTPLTDVLPWRVLEFQRM
jgi:hypothetical protein